MLIHGDVDDEETLDEEEALQSKDEIMEELDNLQEVGEKDTGNSSRTVGVGGARLAWNENWIWDN